MSIHRIGKIWHIDISFDGRRIRQSTQSEDRVAAQQLHDELKAALWQEKHRGKVPWTTAVVAYMKEKQGQPSYPQDLARLRELNPWLGHVHVQDISRGVVEDIKAELRTKKSPATVNRTLNLIRAILNYAVRREWLDHAPYIQSLKLPPPKVEYLTPGEVDALLPHLKVHQQEWLMLALSTGLRMRNLTHLTWDQVNLFTREITLTVKGGYQRTIPLDDDAMTVLKARARESTEGRVLLYRGKPYDRVGVRALNTAAKAAGIKKHIHPHLLRHTFASWHIMSGTSLAELQQLGGWAKLESVMIYAHLSAAHLHSAAKNRATIKRLVKKWAK